MLDCIFCKLIKKEVPGHFVLEEQNTVAFLDIFGSAPGHVLVVHKNHGYSIQDYKKEELGELMESVKIVSERIEKALKSDSISIGINHKEEQGVPHLHIHLIPRFKDDKGGILQSLVNVPIEEDLGKIAEKIRKV